MRIGWGAASVIVAIAVSVITLVFWFGGWVNNVNSRLDNLENRMVGVESEIREMKSEIREMRIIIEERLPPPAPTG